jgi:hypothetical protein
MTNFLYSKLAGYPAAIYSLASINPPADYRSAAIDLNIAYRLSLEIARYTLSPSEQFKYRDSWTHRIKDENEKRMPLTYVMPQYHVLIPKPEDEVHEERLLRFDADSRSFLEKWPRIAETLPTFRQRSETWKTLLSRLVEMLKTK